MKTDLRNGSFREFEMLYRQDKFDQNALYWTSEKQGFVFERLFSASSASLKISRYFSVVQ